MGLKKILPLVILILVSSFFSMAQTGSIKGRVYDVNSNEPIPFANVII
jgi:hypothetical protein